MVLKKDKKFAHSFSHEEVQLESHTVNAVIGTSLMIFLLEPVIINNMNEFETKINNKEDFRRL